MVLTHRRAHNGDGSAPTLDPGDTGAYIGFLGEEGPDVVRRAYPTATWERLTAIKARYDPTNLFRRNHDIPPPHVPSSLRVRA